MEKITTLAGFTLVDLCGLLGLIIMVIGSLTSPSLGPFRGNPRIMIWKAPDLQGRIATLGLAMFIVATIVGWIKGT